MMNQDDDLSRTLRKRLIRLHFDAQSGHLGSSLSCIDILSYIFGFVLRPQDHFVLSKGHAASALYVVLNHYGYLSDEILATYYKDGTKLGAHPSPNFLPRNAMATGSLGHGLPIAVGMAYCEKYLRKSDAKVYVVMSDGECNEGTTWEAASFANSHGLNNLCVLVDRNDLQGFGSNVLDQYLGDLFEACGFQLHYLSEHQEVRVQETHDPVPQVYVIDTIKGRGIKHFEDELESHYGVLSPEQFALAMKELG